MKTSPLLRAYNLISNGDIVGGRRGTRPSVGLFWPVRVISRSQRSDCYDTECSPSGGAPCTRFPPDVEVPDLPDDRSPAFVTRKRRLQSKLAQDGLHHRVHDLLSVDAGHDPDVWRKITQRDGLPKAQRSRGLDPDSHRLERTHRRFRGNCDR